MTLAAPASAGQFRKSFHVSPFMPMDLDFGLRFTQPAARLAVHMKSQRAGGTMFDATLTLERHDINGRSLA